MVILPVLFLSRFWLGLVGFYKTCEFVEKKIRGRGRKLCKNRQRSNVFSRTVSFAGSDSKIRFSGDDMIADF